MRYGIKGIEVLQVTYANGDTERFPEATEVWFSHRNGTLLVRTGNEDFATLLVAALRKWEWVPR